MELRNYQREVILPALEGENIIIWLPTGSGKTRAAAYVCKRHLETRERAKVAVLVNREVKLSDLVICTAKILQNALTSQDQDMHVELTDFSLLVIDECHHTHKDGVYNQIMEDYLERKLGGQRKLPQILGLTASPGTGGATNFQGARQHILQICANLDTAKIMSSQKHRVHLEAQVPQPRKQYDVSHERPQDPLGRKLKETMVHIHQYLDVCGMPQDFGTQTYEQRIVKLEKEGAVSLCHKTRMCAIHLRKYNNALLINDTVRMIDAFNALDNFYQLEKTTKDLQDPTKLFLVSTFEKNRTALLALASDPRYENPKLSKLEEILQYQFKTLGSSRGIIFTKTRQSAHALHKWIQENMKLARLGVKAAVLTGAGYSNQTKHMTQNEQQDVIKLFRKGDFNLLFSTSVAEEGLDIPECNIVVRYGLMTNEIAMVQARGRARAENSLYSVLAKAHSKEVLRERLNETLEELTQRVIEEVQAMPEKEYRDTVRGPALCHGAGGSLYTGPTGASGPVLHPSHAAQTAYLVLGPPRARPTGWWMASAPRPEVETVLGRGQSGAGGASCRMSVAVSLAAVFPSYLHRAALPFPQITDLQQRAIISRKVKKAEGNQKRQLHNPDAVRLHCINCNMAVCHGSDLRTVEKMHHVNVNPDFKIYYSAMSAKVEISRNFKDWKPGGSISCASCGQAWGMEMIYRSVTLPILSIKNFVVATPDGNQQPKQWSRVTFAIEEFDYVEYCSSNLGM
ncbi:probable ATP-dependent RNA helicase DHX58 isoform X2 [Dermochelys coriacea]|uniref:probable ATP-dependent RNA helicase DHX58 isoform X2 n=1 Tax=Dermochelys coriacea TaxID=27794 RepID=UPI001CA88020|nr:probable ATP-dependent RNA helicase DHX58 isoform X2 [Dermochelys coriacea]